MGVSLDDASEALDRWRDGLTEEQRSGPRMSFVEDYERWRDQMEMTQAKLDGLSWKAVESSNIERLAFAAVGPGGEAISDCDEGLLYVQFAGGRVYAYADVPRELWVELVHAIDDASVFSVGRFVAQSVKGQFDAARIDVVDGE
jgi:hypothetical protein